MTASSPSLRQRKNDLTDLLKGHSSQRAVDNQPTQTADASSVKSSKLNILPFLSRARTKSVSSRRSSGNTDSDHRPADPDVHSRPTPVPTHLAPSTSSPSLGSKLAAHLAPLRHRRSHRTKLQPDQNATLYDSTRALSKETLQPPSPTRRSPSFDSAVSSASRSVTPRPQHPKITVSHPPRETENLDEFADLFTLPSSPKSVDRFPRSFIPSSAEAVLSRIPTPSQSGSEVPTAIPAPINKSTVRRRHQADEKSAQIPITSSAKPPLAVDTQVTGAETSRRTRPAKLTSTIPLPSGPPPTPPPSRAGPTEARQSSSIPGPSKPVTRKRAHTLSTSSPPTTPLPRPPTPSSQLPTPPASSQAPPSLPPSFNDTLKSDVIDKKDIPTATVEQLRKALMAQYTRFDQLAAYVTTVSDMHTAEKTLLEDRIDTLEKEAKKREKEMKGLRWLVMNNGSGDPSGSQPSSTSVRSAPTHEPPSRMRGMGLRRLTLVPHGNSESESGFDSPLGVSSVVRRKKTPPTSQLLSAGSGSTPYLSSSSKRSSISSFTSSAASSTSSLLHQSPSLSAIPETPPLIRSSREFSTPTSSEPEFDKKRSSYAIPAPHRLSSSSTSSSISGLHYTPNIGRSRPSSIAQVLHQSSGMSPRKSRDHS